MDEFLNRAGSQAVSFAIKSGISLASSYAIKRISNFIVQIPTEDAKKIEILRSKLEDRIEIVSSAIDLIKLVAARGNTNLQSTLKLTKGLKEEIDLFEVRIEQLLENVENSTNSKKQADAIRSVEQYITDLMKRIEEVTPFINLSLTTSGANLNTALPKQISPGLLLNASNCVVMNNNSFDNTTNNNLNCQVGPVFEITLFNIFYNTNAENPITWKEDMKRAFVKINRIENENHKYDYNLQITQSFDDERYHNTEDGEEIPQELTIHIDDIKKIFFSISGKLLKLEENDKPVLVLKTETVDTKEGQESNPSVSWVAFGSYESTEVSSDEDEESEDESGEVSEEDFVTQPSTNEIVTNKELFSTSISLLEYIVRLTSLQYTDQKSLLQINDERLSLFLNDENPHPPQKVKEPVNIQEVIEALKNVSLE